MTPFRWDDHGNSIMEKVADFYCNHVNTDCVFVVDGDKIRGHRVILRSASKYFERILKRETEEEEILMKNMKFCDLKYAFDFIYFGKVEVPENQLPSFIETAVLLEITGFKGTYEMQKIATVESVRSDFSPSSNLHRVGRDSEIEGTGNVVETMKMEDTFLKEEMQNIEEILCDENSDGYTKIHSDLDLREGDDDLKEPAFFFCDKSQQSSLNDEVVKGENIELCGDPLFVSKEDLKIEKEVKRETVSCNPIVAEEIAERQCPANEESVDVIDGNCLHSNVEFECETGKSVAALTRPPCNQKLTSNDVGVEENTSEIYDDSLFHSEVDIKSEDDCQRGSHTSLSRDDEKDNESGDAICNGKINDLGAKMALSSKNGALISNYCSDHSPKMKDLNSPYACDICSYSCSHLGHLKRHKRTHSGEKPYACDICSSCFTQLGSLKIHMRTHSGEKPYACDICSSSFYHIRYLKIHKRSHAGEKPFRCDFCGKCFTVKKYLASHMKIHLRANEEK